MHQCDTWLAAAIVYSRMLAPGTDSALCTANLNLDLNILVEPAKPKKTGAQAFRRYKGGGDQELRDGAARRSAPHCYCGEGDLARIRTRLVNKLKVREYMCWRKRENQRCAFRMKIEDWEAENVLKPKLAGPGGSTVSALRAVRPYVPEPRCTACRKHQAKRACAHACCVTCCRKRVAGGEAPCGAHWERKVSRRPLSP